MTSTPTTPFSQVTDPLHNYELMKRVMDDALAPYKQDLEKVKEKTKRWADWITTGLNP